jgi:hypothetical protein
MSGFDDLVEYLREGATPSTTITISLRDSDGQLIKLLTDIKEASSVGHSFTVVVDPDEQGGRSYGIDGDGAFAITDIKVKEI